jgi:cephalosporin hydroxylase
MGRSGSTKGVFHDAHDGGPAQAVADGIAVRESAFGERLVDDDDWGRGLVNWPNRRYRLLTSVDQDLYTYCTLLGDRRHTDHDGMQTKSTDLHAPEATAGASARAFPQEVRDARRGLFAMVIAAVFLGFVAGGIYFRNHPTPEATLRNFHQLNYLANGATWSNTTWMGVPAMKTPQDMWVYQEILHDTRPDVLIEAGTADGGSAYYFATIFDLMGHGRVITIDILDSAKKPKHNRIEYILGSSTAPETVARIRSVIAPGERVMVSLDSDHRKAHVANELKIYSELVTPGCYMVVEDTNVNGHPVRPDFGPGPMEALQDFLKVDRRYQSDLAREKFGMTFFPYGWLRRVR